MKTSALYLFFLSAFFLSFFSACNPAEKDAADEEEYEERPAKKSRGKWSGKLVTEYSGDIRYYDFKRKEETTVFKEARQPFVTGDGEILTVSGKFPKSGYLIQIADPEFNEVRPLIDLSDNWFGGYIYGVKMSPDGNYLAVGVTSYGEGYSNYKITKDAVLVFDLEGNIVSQFDNKYQPDWTPDGKLIVAGALKAETSSSDMKTSAEPGIFISNRDFSSLKRIDPELNNPAPCNVAVSPDGERIAFIKNNHVWVMGIDGSDPHAVTASGGDNEESFPAWSPDGKYIACWVYKTFENTYYSAIAIVPADTEKPIKLTNDAPVWPRNGEGYRISGGAHQFSWVKK